MANIFIGPQEPKTTGTRGPPHQTRTLDTTQPNRQRLPILCGFGGLTWTMRACSPGCRPTDATIGGWQVLVGQHWDHHGYILHSFTYKSYSSRLQRKSSRLFAIQRRGGCCPFYFMWPLPGPKHYVKSWPTANNRAQKAIILYTLGVQVHT